MKKFSYADEFNRVADVVRLGDADDVRISYSVFVGSSEDEADDSFLGNGFFSADDFTTWSDAAKAKQLALIALKQVDKHLAPAAPTKKSADLRRAVLQAADQAIQRGVDELDTTDENAE